VSDIAPGWYRDPVDPTIQRYWDGEGYLGEPLPADVTPPPGPPQVVPPPVPSAGIVNSAPSATASRPGRPAPASGSAAGPGRPQTAGPYREARGAGPAPGIPAAPTSPPPATPTSGVPGAPTSPPPGVPVSGPPTSAPPGATSPAAPPGSPAGAPGSLPGQGRGPYPPAGPYTPPRGTPPIPGGPTMGSPPGMPGWPAYPRLVLPAPRPHGYRLAGLGARFMARFIDTLAVLGLNILVNGYFVYQYYKVNLPFWQEFRERFYAGESTAGVEPPERSSTLLIIILVLATALWFAYEVPAQANTGQTLGKRLLGIKVMRLESDEPLGFRRSIRRWNTIGLPTLVWPCYGVGFVLQFVDAIWPTFDRPMHQALHDKSAVTVVVQATPAPSPTERRADNDQQANDQQANDQQERPA